MEMVQIMKKKKKNLLRVKGTIRKKKHKWNCSKHKNLYSREDSSSSNEDDSDTDSGRVLFMSFEDKVKKNEDDSQEDGEVDLEAELVSAISELKN